EIGLIYYLSFMALISVNLGIMNLFPLPVLDGGHLVFLAAEAVKGKPVSDAVQNIAYRIGAFLLLMLTAFALFNDFLRL
ncbi:MAG: site-2 protease family protein, partial [[Pasteurella] aerogenes]|nr:site-2 protease family protein [[Pasteurella] aerogenes]